MKPALALVLLSAPALAQSINIDFGTPGTSPSPSYAAAGRPGFWNTLGVIGTTPQPLVGLWGQPTPVTIYNLGGSAMLNYDNPATSGDDAALLDDMFISFNNPVDLCLYVYGLRNGQYEVVVYGIDPDNAAHQNRIRVDTSSPGPTWIGGAWTGQHQLGITYSRHTLSVVDGRLFPHSGQYGANYQSGINGLQLIFLGECYANCDGSTAAPALNVADFACFLNLFAGGEPMANCDLSTSPPVLNVADFACFLNAFAGGCP